MIAQKPLPASGSRNQGRFNMHKCKAGPGRAIHERTSSASLAFSISSCCSSPSASAFWDKTSPAASWSPFPPPSPCTVHKMLDMASQGSGESPLLEGLKSRDPTWGQCWVNVVLNDLRDLFQPKRFDEISFTGCVHSTAPFSLTPAHWREKDDSGVCHGRST